MAKKRIADRGAAGSFRDTDALVSLPRRALPQMQRPLDRLDQSADQLSPCRAERGQFADVARRILDFRQRRTDVLPSELFGEPAWDILLALHAGIGPASVRALSEMLRVPVSTVIRWTRRMEEDGLVTRETRRFRPRLTVVRPTEKSRAIMNFYFTQMIKNGH